MAKTSGTNTYVDPKSKSLIDAQIDNLKKQLTQKLNQYKKQHGVPHSLSLVEGEDKKVVVSKEEYDFVNPDHYVQKDGRQTWEYMVDKWGEEKVALWCQMTAFKYQDRIGKKPGEDVEREQEKIKWYEEKADYLLNVAKKKKFW